MTMPKSDDERLRLKVADIREIARDIHLIELRSPDDAPLPPFTAGSHLVVDTPAGAVRRYSLCNDPAEDDRYVIAVKVDAQGRGGSVSMAGLKPGDTLSVSPPDNAFALSPKARRSLLIAGGIGITPVLAMARHLHANDAPFKLVYCTRDAAGTAFLDELRQSPFSQNVVIHHDEGNPDAAFDFWPLLETPKGTHVYCCGPRGLMEAVRDMTGHWPSDAVHFESFGVSAELTRTNVPFDVVLQASGQRVHVDADTSILEAVRAAGVSVASSCESGTCGSCRTRLVAGEVEHRDMVLLDEEKADNIMICVSRSCGGELVLGL
ncbi:oxidoreductase [Achromobacter sp. GG226]|uniref:PDR/VanB family oxidoreductase n=1 Tax=Verticiella alkaliphila TaxID=2779529 RepID=UPI001C0D9EAD|nr:PDR/VanB family oxidoreductase [Verticiella sp. GG226]MBU4609693.1 oxidoreductase [Verticiella sp. GG226]